MFSARVRKLRARPWRLAVVGAVLVSALLAGTALAVNGYDFPPTEAGVSATAGPATVTTPKGPTSLRINFTTTLKSKTDPSLIPATVDQVTVYVSQAAVLNGKYFPSCSATKLSRVFGEHADKICPKGSKIGTLNTLGYYAQLKEPIRADIYNTNGGKAMLFFFYGDNPVVIRVAVVGKLTRLPASSIYGYKISMKIPEQLQDPVPGTYASFRTLNSKLFGETTVKVGRKKVKKGYFEIFMCPIGGQAPLRIDYKFLDGTSSSAEGFARCTR